MTAQIMSGTKKLSENNTRKSFNRVLVALFDSRQRFKKKSQKFWGFSDNSEN